ncbi:MAG TPA: ATP-binding protein, partial [Candidatus Marinimicrobia bacterium]|nr:ATP-binding protein [Candidatus Neomarinimicrobiota bacterium]
SMDEQFIYRDIIDRIAIERESFPVIWLSGAARTGKTLILKYLQANMNGGQSAFYIDMSDFGEYELVQSGFVSLIRHLTQKGYKSGENISLLLDNVQFSDNLPELLRILLEKEPNIHFILAGTMTDAIQEMLEISLKERYIMLTLLPYSFREFLRAKEHSDWLEYLPDLPFAISENPFPESIRDELQALYEEYLIFGGYPEIAAITGYDEKAAWLRKRVSAFVLREIPSVYQINKRHSFVQFVMQLANQQGELYNEAYFSRTLRIKPETLHKWLSILCDFGIVDIVTPHHQNNANELIKMSKIFFLDSGLRNALINNFSPLNNRNDVLGLLEQGVFIALRKYPQWMIHFWRSKQGQHIHFILKNDLELLPIELKAHTRTSAYVQRWSKRNGFYEAYVINLEGFLQKKELRYLPAYCL